MIGALKERGLWPSPTANGHSATGRRIAATYTYESADGTPLFEVCRFDPKGFAQRLPGAQSFGLNGTAPVLYHLPEILRTEPGDVIFLVEGEKDCDGLRALEATATTCPMGAGKWREHYNEALAGRQVVILPDNDPPGRDHAEQVAQSLAGVAASVRIVALPDLPDKGDVSDWIASGGTVEHLCALVEAASPFLVSRSNSIETRNEKRETDEGATRAPPSGFRLVTLAELLAEPEEATPWLVEGLLPSGGISLIAAKPKVGKTTTLRHLGLCVARGAPFLGRETAQGRVLLLCLEEKRHEVRRLLAALGGTDEAIDVHVGAAPAEGLAAFEAALAGGDYRLAIVDPMAKLVRLKDLSDYAQVSAGLEPLIELARRYDCHIALAHHLGKADRTDADDILGSTAIYGAVDSVLVLKKRDQGRTLYTIQRYGGDLPETVITLSETGEIAMAGDVQSILLKQVCEAVFAAIPDGESLTETEIRERAGGETRLQVKALRQLVTDGWLVRRGAGKRGDPYEYGHP